MVLEFIGADREVTGSCHYLTFGDTHILIDCGMEQGADLYVNQEIPVNPSLIDYVFVTHAHIDHSGLLPLIYNHGFRGTIFATKATTDLCNIMLKDSAHIQEFEAEWKNRKARRAGRPEVTPMYNVEDAQNVMQHFTPCDYNSVYEICPGLKVRFVDAGHLLGSSSIEMWVTEENVTKNDLTEVTDPSLQQLLEGHVLLFAGYNEKAGCYKGWISRDAGVWRMSLGSGTEAAVIEVKSGKLTWNNTNAQKDTAYPVTIYWIWPERLESYLRKADGYSGKNPLLFPENLSSEENALLALPENLFATMSKVEKNSSSNRYFRWEDSAKFQENVTKDTLSQIREKFNPALYSMVAAYYDSADQYLGKNVQYVQLKLDAQ